LVVALACQEDVRILSLPESFLEDLDRRGRTRADLHAVTPLSPAFQVSLPPTATPYVMENRFIVSGVGFPVCALAVADYGDLAVHVFSLTGNYRYSVFGGDREHPLFANATSVGFDAEGELYVADRSGLVTVVSPRGSIRDTLRVPRRHDGVASQVILGPYGKLYDHWFAWRAPDYSARWPAQTPLVRVWDLNGQQLDSMGSAHPYPGETFTHALNRGQIALRDDTLWFARRGDARLLAFSTTGGTSSPVREIELPLYYHMRPPIEGRTSGHQIQNAVAAHLVAFATGLPGQLLVAQSVSWPDGGSVFRPRTVLATLGGRASEYRAFDLGGEIRGVAAADRWVYVILLAGGRSTVQAFRNPTLGYPGAVDSSEECDPARPVR
jgi:hypothetical protein